MERELSVIAGFIVGTFNYQLTSLKLLRSAEPASSLCSRSIATLSIVNYAAQEATPMAPASAVSTAMRILSNLPQSNGFIVFRV